MRMAVLPAIVPALGWAGQALAVEADPMTPRSCATATRPWTPPDHIDAIGRCDTRLLAGRGCCSHHRGQCGCQKGRVVCCDGTLSPSCRCAADDRNATK